MIRKLMSLRRTQIWQVAGKFRLLIGTLAFSLAGQAVATLVLPWPIKYIIDHIIRNVPSAGEITSSTTGLGHLIIMSAETFIHSDEFDFLYVAIGFYILIILLNSCLLYVQNITLSRLGQMITLEVRSRLFNHIMALPSRFFDNSQSGDLTNRISKDTSELSDIIEAVTVISVRSLPTVIGILLVAFWIDWIYALSFVFVIPVAYWAASYFSKLAKKAMRHQRRIEGLLASTAQEAIYHHKAVASLSLENEIAEDLIENGRQSASMGICVGRYEGMMTSLVEFVVSLSAAAVLFIGTLRIMHGCLTVGTMMVFLSYLNSLFKPIREFAKFMGKIAKSMASNDRIEEIMNLSLSETGNPDTPDAIQAPVFKGAIRFEHVRFAYRPDQIILNNIDLRIRPGEKVGIVGESGSGKTTLLNLLLRFYEPASGKILIDDRDIRSFTLQSLRSQLAVVLQESYIFDTSVRENIALAKINAGFDEIEAAAKNANAHDFIADLPEGYETNLGESGARLSGGQKRRLVIARAVLRNAPIVILDEPTTGLDASSERKVLEALENLTRNRTTLIVTHRLSAVTGSHRIIVMDKGCIAGQGTHSELMENNELYKRLWKDQNGDSSDSCICLPGDSNKI